MHRKERVGGSEFELSWFWDEVLAVYLTKKHDQLVATTSLSQQVFTPILDS